MPVLKQIYPVQGYAKYKQTKDLIYSHILRSGAQPGDKVCTEAALIKELGISVTTVRRALEEMVREGILVRRVGKGTFLRNLAPERRNTGSTVLLLGHNSWQFLREDVYYGPIVNTIGLRLRDVGFRQVVLVNEWGQEPEAELEDIRRHDPAAIIYPHVGHGDKPLILALATLGIPLMIYGHPMDGLAAGQIYFDDYQGGVDMANYMIGQGYETLALMAAPAESPAGQQRVCGFLDTVKRHPKAQLVGHIVASGYTEMDGYQGVEGLLAGKQPPRGIFCAGDLLAYGAIKRLEEAGLAVPSDVAIAGYGDFQVNSFYHPRLTTIHTDLAKMGSKIGDWVARVAQADEQHRESYVEMLPVKLIVRDTA